MFRYTFVHQPFDAVFYVRLQFADDVGLDGVVESEVFAQSIEIRGGLGKHPVSSTPFWRYVVAGPATRPIAVAKSPQVERQAASSCSPFGVTV